MSNVKAGDLAIVVWSRSSSNLGRIVDVISQCPTDGFFDLPCGHEGRPLPVGKLVWIVKFIGGPGYRSPTRQCVYAHFSDTSLRRLPGDESTDDTTTEREVTA